MSRILVTGGSGFIGSHLSRALIASGHEVLITGLQTEAPIPEGVQLLKSWIENDNWNALDGIEAIFHQAGNNDTQSLDETEMFTTNYYRPIALFQEAYRRGCKKYIFASSTAVYGNSSETFIENKTPLKPLTFYGESKLRFEQVAMEFAKEKKEVSVIGLRYCNVYGPNEHHKGKRASMVHQILEKLREGGPVRLFEDGRQRRDWIYVADVVAANLAAFEYKESGLFNCGTGDPISFNNLVHVIGSVKNKPVEIEYIPNPIADSFQSYTCCNIEKIKKHLNWSPSYDLPQGVSLM